jgi:hypothetical protein
MTRAPDLSAFPIPRKGGAKPIVGDDPDATPRRGGGEGPAEASSPIAPPRLVPEPDASTAQQAPAAAADFASSVRRPTQPREPLAPRPSAAPLPSYSQSVATTVKLDENRYLRLMEAGKPSPGRLKRRTIQDMLIEALDEWFERRRL